MITQKFLQGKNEIKIEVPESLDDRIKNNFKDGQQHKIYVNGKYTESYMSMIQFMIDESRKQNSFFIPNEKNFQKSRKQLFENQKKEIQQQFAKLKDTYKQMNVPDNILDTIDEFQKKISIEGVRMKR